MLSFILLGLFLTSLPQTQAVRSQPAPKRDTLMSPNPVAYVPYWVSGGQYGQTVACGGNYIFVHCARASGKISNFALFGYYKHFIVY